MGSVFDLFAKLSLDSSAFETGLSKAKQIGSTVAKASIAAVGAASAAVTAFGVSSVKVGMEFDSAMSQVAATMGKTMDEMEQQTGTVELAWGTFTGNLTEYAQEMGKNTAFSATQAAEALNYMALAGYDTQTSMEMLPNVLNLAAAGSIELARASDMVTDVQTAFGISLDRTTQLVDEMAKAASTGNTSVEQLGDAFLTVGGLAQELNGGFVTLSDGSTAAVDGVQELEIALTAMANAGVKGSEAGTHMRNMLLKLSSPSADGAKQLEQLGVAVFDAEGNMRSMKDIMGDLNGALGNLTQEQKIQAISDLFNTRDLASAEALLNAVGQDWDAIGESILNADGAAEQMANTQLDNLQGDITLFKSALEGAQIAISDVLSPELREFVQFGTDGISRLTSAFQEGGLTGAMGEFGNILSEGLSMLVQKAPEFIDAGIQLLSALGQGLLDNLPMIIDTAVVIIEKLVDAIIQAAPKILEGASQIVIGLTKGLAKAAPKLVNGAIALIKQLTQLFIQNFPLLVQGAIEIVKAITQGLTENADALVQGVFEIIQVLIQTLTDPETLMTLLECGFQILLAITDGIANNLPLLFECLGELIANLILFIGDAVPSLVENIGKFGAKVVTDILPQILEAIGSAVSRMILTVSDGISDKMIELKEKASEFFGKIPEALMEGLAYLAVKISEFAGDAIDFFSNGFQKIKDVGTALVQGIWNGINDAKEWVLSKIRGFGDSIVSGIKSIFGVASPSKRTAEVGKFLAEGLAIGVEDEAPAAFRDIQNALDDGMNGLNVDDIDVGTNIGVQSYKNPQQNALQSAVEALYRRMDKLAEMGFEVTVPVYIAGQQIDEFTINSKNRIQVRSGGQVDV